MFIQPFVKYRKKIKIEVHNLQKEVLSLKIRNRELQDKIQNLILEQTIAYHETEEIEVVKPKKHLDIDWSLEALINSNSWFSAINVIIRQKIRKD